MKIQAPTLEEARNLYAKLARVNWKTVSKAELIDILAKRVPPRLRAEGNGLATRMALLARAANEIDEESFCAAVVENELPPMKLTAQDMEALRGGISDGVAHVAAVAYLVFPDDMINALLASGWAKD